MAALRSPLRGSVPRPAPPYLYPPICMSMSPLAASRGQPPERWPNGPMGGGRFVCAGAGPAGRGGGGRGCGCRRPPALLGRCGPVREAVRCRGRPRRSPGLVAARAAARSLGGVLGRGRARCLQRGSSCCGLDAVGHVSHFR